MRPIPSAPLEAHHEISTRILCFAWRDQGRWTDLRRLFTEDATIQVSWYSGPIDGFIDASQRMAAGVEAQTKHAFGVPRVSIAGQRALAETDVSIMARSKVGPLQVDMTAFARFFDRLEFSEAEGWRISSRVAIYDKDRIDSVGPSLLFWLASRLAKYDKYPAELRHLAYGLHRQGLPLMPDIVTNLSEAEVRLKSAALQWLQPATGADVVLP